MSDEMPVRARRDERHLRASLLHAAFTEHKLPRIERIEHRLGRVCF